MQQIKDKLERELVNSDIENYIKAGKIAAQALQYGKNLIKPDSSMIEILDKITEKIKRLGGECAFPPQISCNDTAAHFCPNEEDIILKDQVCSLDVGVHVNGFIGDTALTVDLSGKYTGLINASKEALYNAIKIIKPGISLADIGKTIEETIHSYGFEPVKNLSGHGLAEYDIHTSPNIPNFNTKEEMQLEDGQIIAIEPFASTGAGMIEERGKPTIFQMIGKKPVRSLFTRQLLKEIHPSLPFTLRDITPKLSLPKIQFALRELKQLGILREYPPLVDKNNGIVSQAEHTILVKDTPIILTKID